MVSSWGQRRKRWYGTSRYQTSGQYTSGKKRRYATRRSSSSKYGAGQWVKTASGYYGPTVMTYGGQSLTRSIVGGSFGAWEPVLG